MKSTTLLTKKCWKYKCCLALVYAVYQCIGYALDCYQVQNVLYHHYYTLNDDYYHTLLPFPTNILNYEMKNTFWIKKAGNTVTPQNSNLCSQNKAHN